MRGFLLRWALMALAMGGGMAAFTFLAPPLGTREMAPALAVLLNLAAGVGFATLVSALLECMAILLPAVPAARVGRLPDGAAASVRRAA